MVALDQDLGESQLEEGMFVDKVDAAYNAGWLNIMSVEISRLPEATYEEHQA